MNLVNILITKSNIISDLFLQKLFYGMNLYDPKASHFHLDID